MWKSLERRGGLACAEDAEVMWFRSWEGQKTEAGGGGNGKGDFVQQCDNAHVHCGSKEHK